MDFIHGIIFDMDGVLCDSEPLHMRAWQVVLGELGISIRLDSLGMWVGVADYKFSEHCHTKFPLEITAAELLARKREAYREITERELVLFPGVLAGIQRLAEQGLPLGVATSSTSSEAARNLACLGLLPYLRAVVAAEDVTHPKPDPEPFLLAAACMGVAPERCVVIEDSPTGIAAARAAGCRVLAVATTHPLAALAEAHQVYADPAAALEMLLAKY